MGDVAYKTMSRGEDFIHIRKYKTGDIEKGIKSKPLTFSKLRGFSNIRLTRV